MKLISRILAGGLASVAVLGLAASNASASAIAPYAGQYTYIADFVPGGDPTDAVFFRTGVKLVARSSTTTTFSTSTLTATAS